MFFESTKGEVNSGCKRKYIRNDIKIPEDYRNLSRLYGDSFKVNSLSKMIVDVLKFKFTL